MSETRYNIVFSGELVPGADLQAVKQNLARAFRMEPARVDALFSGKPVTLKRDADQATAMKFRAVMKQAGAQCRMEPVGEVEEIVAAPPPPAEAPAAASPQTPVAPPQAAATAAPPGEMEMVGTIRTGGAGFSGEFDVAPVGADIADMQEGPAPVVPDVSGLSLAPAGSDMGELKREVAVQVPDIGHLAVVPLGAEQGGKDKEASE